MAIKRINALAQEALRQKVSLIFFSNNGIDFEKRLVRGKMYIGGKWLTFTKSFPEVIINDVRSPKKKRTETEKKLREMIPFTTFSIPSKSKVYDRILTHDKYKTLVIPSTELYYESQVDQLLQKFGNIVVKPTAGRQGKGIYFIQKQENAYLVKKHTEEKKMNEPGFSQFLQSIIKEKRHILQPYINCRTFHGEPYDFRVHVQRDMEAKWVVTKIYPRIGNTNSILSNISRGGRTEDIERFLLNEFPDVSTELLEILEETALELAEFINNSYKFMFDELGIDLAIDSNMKMWLYEINSRPQTRYHEKERAVNTIGFSKYVAKNNKNINVKKRPLVAQLTGFSKDTPLKKACNNVADAYGLDYYYFTPRDIDYNNKLINGYSYEGGSRIQKQFSYPDVIFDRFRMRGFKKYKKLYDELNGIPMTNERIGNSVSKEEMYERIKKQGRFEKYLLPFEKYSTAQQLIKYVEKYSKVVVKHSKTSFGSNIHFVEKVNKENFVVQYKQEKTNYTKESLSEMADIKWNRQFIMQPFIVSVSQQGRPSDIRIHLMLDEEQQWRIVKKYARVGKSGTLVSNYSSGGYIVSLLTYIKNNISQEKQGILEEEIDTLVLEFAGYFHELYTERINHIALDIGIDEQYRLWLFEVNINRPGTEFMELEVAEHAIPYALSLI